jgi:hypothetical protein
MTIIKTGERFNLGVGIRGEIRLKLDFSRPIPYN